MNPDTPPSDPPERTIPLLDTKDETFPNQIEQPPKNTFLLEGVTIEKLFATPSFDFLQSLKLRNFTEEKLKKMARDIGAFVYTFKVIRAYNNAYESWIIRRPIKSLIVLDKGIKQEAKKLKLKLKLPAIPFQKDKPQDNSAQNLTFFESYLKIVLTIPALQNFISLSLFLEISVVENEGGAKKYKELYVRKRAGGRYNENQILLRCGAFCKCWNKRYMIITAEGVMYSKGHLKEDSFIRENLLFDHHFELKYGKQETGLERGLNLIYSNRKLHIEALDKFDFFDLLFSLKEAFEHSPYILQNRFQSFAPVRENSFCKFYIDGEEYYHDVCDALLSAQTEVFITDWWLSPELYLKRPVSLTRNTYTRLDRILKRIAENGVMIKIIVYNEPKIALTLDSEHTQNTLQNLHPNITVLRHPGYLLPTFLWSHHEKMVIVDQEVGFLGGLDLCYGRMDNQNHSLYDHSQLESLKKDEEEINNSENEEFFPGIDYSNSRKKDFVNVKQFMKPLISKKEVPRMPWHDIALRIVGEAVSDMSRHFIQYWNFVKFDLEPKKKRKKLFTKGQSLGDTEKSNKSNKSGDNSMNYMERMRRKWTKFKNDMGLKSSDAKEKERNPNPVEKEAVDSRGISLQKKNLPVEHPEDLPVKLEQDQQKQEVKHLVKSEFLPSKHTMGLTDYDIFAPVIRKDNEEIKLEIEENEPVIRNLMGSGDAKAEEKKSDDGGSDEEENEKGEVVMAPNSKISLKKNSYKNRNWSISQSDRNKIDNFERNPKFMLLLKEVQQAKVDGDEDYMKTTKELGSENKPEPVFQLTHWKDNEFDELAIPDERPPKFMKKQKTNIEKIRSFFSRDKEEIIKSRTPKNYNKAFSKTEANNNVFMDKSDDRMYLKDDTILFHHVKKHCEGKAKCQMLRSASFWSLGLKRENYENSIYIAYLALITNAESFIYIENQFFISSIGGFPAPVKNRIAEALLDRIKKAAAEKQRFKVIIFMPLLPGFEGEIDGENSAVLKVQLHYEFLSLSRGGRSLFEELAKDPNISDPFEYISVYGLRNHGVMPNGTPATEIIYIHSKLMIVDDMFVICGSANINDRSMLGKRDSEIAMIIEDTNVMVGKMKGNFCKFSKFAHTLRTKLFMEHFALTAEELEDPLNPQTLKKMDSIARRNTEIYREVFRCYPDDEITSIADYEKFCKEAKPEKYQELKGEIVGHAVLLPLKFLKDENLQFGLKNKEYYVPNHNFT